MWCYMSVVPLYVGVMRFLVLYSVNLFSVSRLEDKESEMKKEYTKLHERYTDVSQH